MDKMKVKGKGPKKGKIQPSTKKRNYPKKKPIYDAASTPKPESVSDTSHKTELNLPAGRTELKAGALLCPLPAVMVTVGDMECSNIITIGWCGILSTDPARAYISVRPSRYSHKLLKQNGEFVINLTTADLAEATDFAGIYTGAKVDKFEALSLTRVKSKRVAPPTVAESPLSLECRVFQVIESGTHDIFMADILSVSCSEKILDGGRIALDKAGLLTYAHGEYFAVGEKLGKFGFSTNKEKRASRRKQNSKKRDK